MHEYKWMMNAEKKNASEKEMLRLQHPSHRSSVPLLNTPRILY